MPDFALPDRPALDELAHTDLLLDALAERVEADLGDPRDLNEDALAALLGDWRDDLRWPPASALVSQQEAEEALIAGMSGMSERTGGRRGIAAVGSVAATLLVLSGFGAAVVEARPGDMLYGLHAMFFDEPRVNDDQVMVSAQADLAKVQQMIDQGDWDQAQDQLAEVGSTLQAVNDGGGKDDLMNQFNLLNTKVETRDPSASRPAPQRAPEAPPTTAQLPAPSAGPKLTQVMTPAPPPPAPPTTTKSHHHGHNPTTTSIEPAAPAPSNGAPPSTQAPATLVNGVPGP